MLTLAVICAGKAGPYLFVTTNRFIPFKNPFCSSAAVFCACVIIWLLSAVFCVVRDAHKFDFRLVINETPNKWRPTERNSCSDEDSYF
jgi:hypothetical protein